MNSAVRSSVKAALKQKGFTQQQVADRLGVNRVYINRMLNGDIEGVSGRWAELLNLLGLELVAQTKEGEE